MRIQLLGTFEIEIDGRVVDDSSFERRHAASLIKLLALSGGRRLHREQVIDALWPDATLDEAAPRLHKAASYARSATGDKECIVVRDEIVMLWPNASLDIDVAEFDAAADLALSGSLDEAAAAADLYVGTLLPSDPYEEWISLARDRLHLRNLDVLRAAGRWEAILAIEPADEEAHLALMRQFVAEGQRLATLRQYERLERALSDEMGLRPGQEADSLRQQVISEQTDHVPLINRGHERELMQRALDEAQAGAGSFVLLSGEAGIGKSALGDWLVDRCEQNGWLGAKAIAASVDGPWPYAPVLEAIDELLRQAPDLVDQLPETHRDELDRVRNAPQSSHDGFGDDDGHQRLFVAVDEVVRLASKSHGVVIFIDDLHAADEASLALLHYIARQASRSRLLLIGTARSTADAHSLAALRGLVGRHGARELRVGPFTDVHVAEMVVSIAGAEQSAETVERVMALSGGSPFYVEELTKSLRSDGEFPEHLTAIVASTFAGVSSELRDALSRVAIVGLKFDTDQFIALSGAGDDQAFRFLDEALGAQVLAHVGGGYQFRHGLVRESLLEGLAPHHRLQIHHDAAHRFEAMGAPPARIAHHLIAADQLAEAAPWALRAAKAAQAVGALSDARSVIASVLDSSDGEVRLGLLATNADVLAGMGDPRAIAAYRVALSETEGPMCRLLRAKMARAGLMAGDVDVAVSALDGLEADGGLFDGPVLHAQGMLAYFTGDLELAEALAAEARGFALGEGAPAGLLDVLTLQGMVAHNKGEWFDRMRVELTSTADSAELAQTVFDCHL